jgi:MFS family permease
VVPIVASAQHPPQHAARLKVRYRDLFRNSPLGVVAVTFSGMISSIIFSMGPVYAHLNGFSNGAVANFMAVSIFAAVLSQYPVGRLSDRLDRRTVIAFVCTAATIVAGLLVAFPALPNALFLTFAALFSGFALTLYSLAVSHVNDKLEAGQMVGASSALLSLNGTSAAFGPVLAGSLIAAFGPPAYYTTLAALTGTLTIYDLWRKTRREAVPAAQKGPFITVQPQGMAGRILEVSETPAPGPAASAPAATAPAATGPAATGPAATTAARHSSLPATHQ